MTKKKTLYKIPTEKEISDAEAPVSREATVTPEPPIVEPEPVAVLDTALDIAKKRIADEKAKSAATRLTRIAALDKQAKEQEEKENLKKAIVIDTSGLEGDPVEDFSSISLGLARQFKSNEEARRKYTEELAAKNIETKEEPKDEGVAVLFNEDRKARQSNQIDLSSYEGIMATGRNVIHAKNARKLTRDRRREHIEKRKSMKVMVAGEEQDLSEASKYMLDMLIKNPTKD